MIYTHQKLVEGGPGMDNSTILNVLQELRNEKALLDSQTASVVKAIAALEEIVGKVHQVRTTPTTSTVTHTGTVAEPDGVVATIRRRRAMRGDDGSPRGAAAVREVLIAVGTDMDVKGITAELHARGWEPVSSNPENATSSNAARAAEVYPDVSRRRGAGGSYLYRYGALPLDRPTHDALNVGGYTNGEVNTHLSVDAEEPTSLPQG